MITLPAYSQLEPKWGAKRIPTKAGTITMSSDGCYVTSLTMLLANYAIYLDPGQCLDKLIGVSAFLENGFLTYDGVMRAFPDVIFSERVYTKNDPSKNIVKIETAVAIEKVKRYLRLGQPVILCVDNLYNDRIPDHAVVLYDYDGLHFWIHDPDGGKTIAFDLKYGDPMTNLYGYIALIGPPINFPKDGLPGFGQALWKMAKFKKENGSELNKLKLSHYVSEAIESFVN